MFIFRWMTRLTLLFMLLTAGATALIVTVAVVATDGFGSDSLVNVPQKNDGDLVGNILEPEISLNEAIERQPIFEKIPLPSEISTDPPVVGTNLTLTLILALLFGLISTMLNNLLREKEQRLEEWLSIFYLDRLWGLFRSSTGPAIQRGCLGTPILLLVFAVYGIIFAYVQEGQNIFDPQGTQLAVVLAMAVTLVSLSGDVAQRQVAWVWGKTATYGIYPMNVVLVIFTTLFSRIFGLIPGILYGVPGGIDIDMENEPRFRDVVLIVVTIVVLVSIGLGGWGVVAWLHAVGDKDLSLTALEFAGPLVALAQTMGLALMVLALETAFFEMAPVAYTMGGRLFRWNALAWAIFFAPITFAFLHVILNPKSQYLDAFSQIGVTLLMTLVILLAVATAFIWVFLTFAEPPRPKTPPAPNRPPQPIQSPQPPSPLVPPRQQPPPPNPNQPSPPPAPRSPENYSPDDRYRR